MAGQAFAPGQPAAGGGLPGQLWRGHPLQLVTQKCNLRFQQGYLSSRAVNLRLENITGHLVGITLFDSFVTLFDGCGQVCAESLKLCSQFGCLSINRPVDLFDCKRFDSQFRLYDFHTDVRQLAGGLIFQQV